MARDHLLDPLDTFATSLDAALVTQVLKATRTASVRRRKLPAERAVWLMLAWYSCATGQFRRCAAICIWSSLITKRKRPTTRWPWFRRVGLVLPPLNTCSVLLWLIMDVNNQGAHRWRGPTVLGIDGTTIRVPDSDENRAHFNMPKNGGHRESVYPQARAVGLMALGSHFLLDLKNGALRRARNRFPAASMSICPTTVC